MFFASFHLQKNDSTKDLKYIYSCTIGLASEFMKKKRNKRITALFYIKKPLYRYGLKRVILNNI